MRPTDRAEVICHLRGQVKAIHQTIQMLQRECPCIEVIKHIQRVQVALHVVNSQLMNSQLEACLAVTAQTDDEQVLDEISAIFACVDKSVRETE
jgi:DNA-binding FrmR family transcriptional regulator